MTLTDLKELDCFKSYTFSLWTLSWGQHPVHFTHIYMYLPFLWLLIHVLLLSPFCSDHWYSFKISVMLTETKDFRQCTPSWAEPSKLLSARRLQQRLHTQSVIRATFWAFVQGTLNDGCLATFMHCHELSILSMSVGGPVYAIAEPLADEQSPSWVMRDHPSFLTQFPSYSVNITNPSPKTNPLWRPCSLEYYLCFLFSYFSSFTYLFCKSFTVLPNRKKPSKFLSQQTNTSK